MVSSTILDLPDHRKAVIDAIIRANFNPVMMESKSSSSKDSIAFSLKLVEDADIYIGILGYRYGYVPNDPNRNPERISITELEYKHAEKLKKSILFFFMSDKHLIESNSIEHDPENLLKLNKFKDEIKTKFVISFFNSTEQLAYQAYQSLVELHEDIREHAQSLLIQQIPLPYVKSNLPNTSYTKFIGREKEKNEIISLLRPYPNSQYHLIIIDGIGGVGKSTLALEIANYYVNNIDHIDETDRFKGVVWTSAKKNILTAKGIVRRSNEQILRNLGDIYAEIARVYDRPDILAVNADEQTRLIRHLLSIERTLIIVDNLETVDDEAILSFLREIPAPSKALITTRHRIDGAFPMRIEGLSDDERMQLIDIECSRKKLNLDNAQRMELAMVTGGIPLAIVWTIGLLSYGNLNDLERVIQKLKSATKDYSQFTFNEAIQFLRGEKKTNALKLLLGLSLFAESATREALGYVCGIADEIERDEGLSELLQLSLINFDSGRYSMLSLTREYCKAEMAGDLQFREDMTNRWFNWHIQLAGKGTGGQVDLFVDVFSNLDKEHSNVLWAIESSLQLSKFHFLAKLLRGTIFFWLGAGYWRDLELYLNLGRILAPSVLDRIHFAGRMVWLYVLMENSSKAKELESYARQLLKENHDDYELMRLDDFTGQMYLSIGNFSEGERFLRESLRLAVKLADKRGQAACNKYLGELFCATHDLEQAVFHLRTLESIVGVEGDANEKDKWVRAFAHVDHLRGLISILKQDYMGAKTNFENALNYLELWTDIRLQTKIRDELANVALQMNNSEEAANLLSANQKTYKRLGMESKAIETEKQISEIRGLEYSKA